MFKATARESHHDYRTIEYDQATTQVYTSGGVDYIEHENQHKVGICTAISLIQNVEKAIGNKYSPDFQYLLQKKYFDRDWEEGSSIFHSLKVGLKYGFLPIDKWTHTTEQDRELPYSQYIVKLQSLSDEEITRLLALCEKKLTGYTKVDISTKENIAHAIDNSKAGILCRYTLGKEWWTGKDGIPSWDSSKIDPLQSPKSPVGGHAITLSKYDYTTNKPIQTLSNTWGNQWDLQGNAHVNYNNYKMTEAWLPLFDIIPVKHVDTPFEIMMFAVRDYQVSKGIFDFKNEINPAKINIGPKTLALIAKDKLNYKTTMTPQTKTELVSFVQTFTAVLGAAIATNISTLDFNNLSKGALLAFGIAVFRSVIKLSYSRLFPESVA